MIFVNFCENYFELSCKSFSMATRFNAENFMSEPEQDVFDSLRKDDLLALALYLNLNVKKSWRKIDIQRVIGDIFYIFSKKVLIFFFDKTDESMGKQLRILKRVEQTQTKR